MAISRKLDEVSIEVNTEGIKKRCYTSPDGKKSCVDEEQLVTPGGKGKQDRYETY